MRKVLAGPAMAVALAAVVGLAGCGGSAKSSGEAAVKTVTVTTPIDQAPSAQTATVEATTEQSAGITDIGIGQSAKDYNLTFKVESIQVEKSIPISYSDPIQAPAGAKMMVARVTYRNDGKVKADPFCGGNGAVLIDNQDRNFEFDSSNAIFIDNNRICEGIQPGFKFDRGAPVHGPAEGADHLARALGQLRPERL